ncbi:N-(5'-phosphoribosyl)anthranilate isomerase [Tenacibaculum sp. 190524A02b]|uniref:phosphoribosylanthranilate isomerase n=1 Tax=Tenacibaculum vairaonense TaxID=3137860 RepID=UPI0032B13530
MKLKVCGMKYVENIQQVAALQPDYLGFIFYEKSKRNFEGIIPEVPKNIKKVGVFVNEYPEIVVSLAQEYKLQALQLHGDESVAYIQKLKEAYSQAQLDLAAQQKKSKRVQDTIKIIKVFGIKDEFDFDTLKPYEEVVDYFLFDTKGKERGGNGVTFNWEVLKGYNSTKPYFLSGGIGLQEVKEVQSFLQTPAAAYCVALDVNSKFESAPGKKEIDRLKKFKKQLLVG